MKKLLWLDDFRDPSERLFLLDYTDVVWVKDYEEFCEYLDNNDLPDAISFDHDLADEHYDSTILTVDYKEKTGLDCAKKLVEVCEERSQPLPRCIVHSMNPVGSRNIYDYLVNYEKFKNESTS